MERQNAVVLSIFGDGTIALTGSDRRSSIVLTAFAPLAGRPSGIN